MLLTTTSLQASTCATKIANSGFYAFLGIKPLQTHLQGAPRVQNSCLPARVAKDRRLQFYRSISSLVKYVAKPDSCKNGQQIAAAALGSSDAALNAVEASVCPVGLMASMSRM